MLSLTYKSDIGYFFRIIFIILSIVIDIFMTINQASPPPRPGGLHGWRIRLMSNPKALGMIQATSSRHDLFDLCPHLGK